jgi:hypothetical protein
MKRRLELISLIKILEKRCPRITLIERANRKRFRRITLIRERFATANAKNADFLELEIKKEILPLNTRKARNKNKEKDSPRRTLRTRIF